VRRPRAWQRADTRAAERPPSICGRHARRTQSARQCIGCRKYGYISAQRCTGICNRTFRISVHLPHCTGCIMQAMQCRLGIDCVQSALSKAGHLLLLLWARNLIQEALESGEFVLALLRPLPLGCQVLLSIESHLKTAARQSRRGDSPTRKARDIPAKWPNKHAECWRSAAICGLLCLNVVQVDRRRLAFQRLGLASVPE